ncbi:MAG: ABC transporter permease [Puniceicoccales bacterium]|jgi:phospholipid/cholesterol/gamma-HCH transport system permease protein|nr:ABC transporter permease [Puniceicoccales bacterium]
MGYGDRGGPEIILEGTEQMGWHLELCGDWKLEGETPRTAADWLEGEGAVLAAGKVLINAISVDGWDRRLVSFLFHLRRLLEERGLSVKLGILPAHAEEMLRLASVGRPTAGGDLNCPGKTGAKAKLTPMQNTIRPGLAYVGDIARGIGRCALGRSPIRRRDHGQIFRQVGVDALPIVALISFLTGVILGFVGVVQLARFGAAIYVADLVGIAMAREMASIMVAIILTGRTGAAFASTIGSMRVNGEIDALVTFGLSPVEFLALPRVLSLLFMAPILCVFSVFIGIGGGMAVVVPMFNLSAVQYLSETISAIGAHDFLFGVSKGAVFGLLIGGLSCWFGLRCDRSAEGVGAATTAAVVFGITAAIVADAIFSILGNLLGI